jgi:hypothetical protein
MLLCDTFKVKVYDTRTFEVSTIFMNSAENKTGRACKGLDTERDCIRRNTKPRWIEWCWHMTLLMLMLITVFSVYKVTLMVEVVACFHFTSLGCFVFVYWRDFHAGG